MTAPTPPTPTPVPAAPAATTPQQPQTAAKTEPKLAFSVGDPRNDDPTIQYQETDVDYNARQAALNAK